MRTAAVLTAWSRGWGPTSFEEFTGRIVGQYFSAGLSGGAVEHGIASIADGSDVVATVLTGLAVFVVHF